METFAQAILDKLAPMLYDPATDPLTTYITGISDPFELIQDWASNTDAGEVGWSLLVDVMRCPDEALPWLAQLVGVRLTPGISSMDQRLQIEGLANWKRGTPAAMAAAPGPYLTGTKTVIFRERYDGTANDAPYYLEVATLDTETASPATVEAAIRAQKPAGIILDYEVITGQDFQAIKDNYAAFQDVKNAYLTFQGIRTNLVGT
jgi:hypothetical protein